MNTKIIVVTAVLIALSMTSQPANASLFDWLGSKADASSVSSNWSFEKIYSSLQGNVIEPSDNLSQNSSYIALASQPIVKKAKTTPKTFVVTASAYSSTVDQTDSTPFITAANTYVRDGIVAANFLPMGTRIKIPELYGDKQFIVEDRMNSRYWYNIDLWFADRDDAMRFGRKQVVIEIVS